MAPDRPAREPSEIEVTDEMVKAGAYAMACYSPLFESTEEAVVKIFVAMMKARELDSRRSGN